MERVKAEEQKYLKAACCLCVEMYEKGCKAITFTINNEQVVVDTADVIVYLVGKVEEESK